MTKNTDLDLDRAGASIEICIPVTFPGTRLRGVPHADVILRVRMDSEASFITSDLTVRNENGAVLHNDHSVLYRNVLVPDASESG